MTDEELAALFPKGKTTVARSVPPIWFASSDVHVLLAIRFVQMLELLGHSAEVDVPRLRFGTSRVTITPTHPFITELWYRVMDARTNVLRGCESANDVMAGLLDMLCLLQHPIDQLEATWRLGGFDALKALAPLLSANTDDDVRAWKGSEARRA